VILALALAFAALVMIVFAADTGGAPLCTDRAGVAQEIAEEGPDAECWDGSETQKTISVAAAWPAGILGGLAALTALFFAITGRQGRLMLQLTGAAVLFGLVSILAGNV
jgi:hypothetical protein